VSPLDPAQQKFLLEVYAEREQQHTRNYTLYMVLSFLLGLLSLAIIALVVMAYFTNAAAPAGPRGELGMAATYLLWAGLLGLVWLVIAGVRLVCTQTMPVALHCPRCSVRVDEIGLMEGCCPNCRSRLR
jgi:hypothetical protein